MNEDEAGQTIGANATVNAQKINRQIWRQVRQAVSSAGLCEFETTMEKLRKQAKMLFALLLDHQDGSRFSYSCVLGSTIVGHLHFATARRSETICEHCDTAFYKRLEHCSPIETIANFRVILQRQPRDYALMYSSDQKGAITIDYRGYDPHKARREMAAKAIGEMNESCLPELICHNPIA